MTLFLLVLFGIGTLLSWGYYLACIESARHWRRKPKPQPKQNPTVSILIPARGDDPEQLANFRSFCQQDYPDYQVLFGALDSDDPALENARRVAAEFPERNICIVAGGKIYGNNRKVSNLINMLPAAENEILVLCDSDMRVGPDYLQRTVAPFANPGVGLVTALYRGHHAYNTVAALETLGIGANFLPGVLLVERMGRLQFGLGATMALPRSVLENTGNLGALVDELADDYRLGQQVYRAGWHIALADNIVDTVIGRESFTEMAFRRLRWARTVRAMQPAGWLGNVITYGLVHSLGLLLAMGGRPLGWSIFTATLALRFGSVTYIAGRCAGDRETLRNLPLLPLSDLFEFALWVASFCGRTITWRGERFLLLHDGRLQPLDAPPAPEVA